jgi:hypothetical protein
MNDKEKGFKKIEIASSSDNLRDLKPESFYNKFIILFFVIGAIIFVLILYELKTLFTLNKKKTNRNIKSININKRLPYQYTSSSNIANNKIDDKKNQRSIIKEKLKYEIKISILSYRDNDDIEKYTKFFNSFKKQSLKDFEIIFVDDMEKNDNFKNFYQNLEKNVKLIVYDSKVDKFKKIIDSVNEAKGEYITFFTPQELLTQNDFLENIYKKADEYNIDIFEYYSYHQRSYNNELISHPFIFDKMYFDNDNFNSMKQFHITGKLIQNQLIKNVLESLDKFYLDKEIETYEQGMILLLLLKNAKTFKSEHVNGLTEENSEENCESIYNFSGERKVVDFIYYLKFIFENTDDNVPDKRFAANLFCQNAKYIRIPKEYHELLDETINLYTTCDKISDLTKKKIKEIYSSMKS